MPDQDHNTIQLKGLTAKELQAYISSPEFDQLPVLPISRHRALSHIHNPRLEAEDIIMILAHEGDVLVGYLGVFPDWIYLNETKHRGGWLSCMWVDPRTRGKGLGGRLVGYALESWQQGILVTEFTPAAKRLYDRSEAFIDLLKPIGLRGYLYVNSHYLLPRKKPSLEKYKGLLKTFDHLLNLPNALRLAFWQIKPTIQWEYIQHIDPQLDQWIEDRQAGQIFKRTGLELNWIKQWPWVISGPDGDDYSRRYHFSAIDKRFEFFYLNLYDQARKRVGFMVLAVRDRHLKVPYCYIDSSHVRECVRLIYWHMCKMKLHMLSVFHPELVQYIQQHRHPFILHRPLKRHYIISKKWQADLEAEEKILIQDGDADCAFT